MLSRILELDPAKIAFLRVKWLPNNPDIQNLAEELCQYYNVVLTLQRFNSIKTLEMFSDISHYLWECSKFRLHGPALDHVLTWAQTHTNTWICDKNNLGCLGCGLCADKNGKPGDNILTLNLSSSGECPYTCQDCYAKTFQKKLKLWNKSIMRYDLIHANHKQAGKTAHIKRTRERLSNGCCK